MQAMLMPTPLLSMKVQASYAWPWMWLEAVISQAYQATTHLMLGIPMTMSPVITVAWPQSIAIGL